MSLPECKTKIVCTIGPACETAEMIEKLVLAGMNVARLNFSHGEFAWHLRVLSRIREIAGRTGRQVAVMADLPGPKIRIGRIAREPAVLKVGETFTLSTRGMTGDAARVTVNFPALPTVVKAGDTVFLSDGLIELEVVAVTAGEVRCRVVSGGELRSGKGLNLPGIDLGIGAFTKRDRQCLEFALQEGVDAVSQSFVGSADDVVSLRTAAADLGHHPFIVAKIERAGALERYDEILAAADGIMVARGDLGVEVPIERIAVVQKDLITRAVAQGKPVITATQMLESMTTSRRPTRAEATDVSNAVFDGTDAVMLSAETAMGGYPVESVAMLVRITAYAELHRAGNFAGEKREKKGQEAIGPEDLIAGSVSHSLERMKPASVVTPTVSGATARRISRFRLPAWIVAVSPAEETCRRLMLSYGVHPVHEPLHPGDWNDWVRTWAEANGLPGEGAILTEGPSAKNPDANHRMEIIDLRTDRGRKRAEKVYHTAMGGKNITVIDRVRYDAVLFDLDGVITATAKLHAACWKVMFDDYLKKRAAASGGEFRPFDDQEDYKRYVDGKLRSEGVRSFLRSRGMDLPWGDPSDPPESETVCGLGNRKNRLVKDTISADGVEVYETSVALVKELLHTGFRTAVVSASRNCLPVLEAAGIAGLFEARVDGVVAGEEGLPGKPAPDTFLRAAEMLGAAPARTVVIEDAISGVQAGRAGGFGLVIGVDRKGDAAALLEGGAHVVVADLGDLTVAAQRVES